MKQSQNYCVNAQHKVTLTTFFSALLSLALFGTTLAQSCPPYPSPHQRIGFNVAPEGSIDINDYDAAQLGAGWYHNYGYRRQPYFPDGIHFHQMVRSKVDLTRLPQLLGRAVDGNPGAIWILGNEPDRYGQDGLTPAEYAEFYHTVYTFLKGRDPTSRIAIGGVVQPTPIRLRYLDMVLAEYQTQYGVPMPVEIWDIHNFILPENCGWGASIPPGLDAYKSEAIPCPPTLDDHGDIAIFKAQIRTFRQWMADRGFRDYPLIVSEYGILLSKYHGYDYARVRQFMTDTFDFMLNTTSSSTGYPADGNRLVQEWAWFSLNYWEFDLNTYFGLNGNLFDHDSRQIMPLGNDYANYTKALTVRTIDLALSDLGASTAVSRVGTPIAFNTTFVNRGGVAAQDAVVRFYAGDPATQGTLIGSSATVPLVQTGCYAPQKASFTWTPNQDGDYTIFAQVEAANGKLESNTVNNVVSRAIVVEPVATETTTPTSTPATVTATSTPTPLATALTGTSTATPTPTSTPTLLATAPTSTATTTPTPTSTPTAAMTDIMRLVLEPDAAGQLVYTDQNHLRLVINLPAGAVTETTTFVLIPLEAPSSTPSSLRFAGKAIRVEAYQHEQLVTDFVFQSPALLTVNYSESQVANLVEDELMLYGYDDEVGAWRSNGITLAARDDVNNQLSVYLHHLSEFGLFAPGQPTPTVTPTPTATVGAIPTPTSTPTSTQTVTQGEALPYRSYFPFVVEQ
ncbi:MAG: CARDB domain-containing protein [Caldilineaceae bacterium]